MLKNIVKNYNAKKKIKVLNKINFSFKAKFKGNYINDANFSQHKI